MNAIKSFFSASIFIAASAANATVWNITATGSRYYESAGYVNLSYNGLWDDVTNAGSWSGIEMLNRFPVSANFTQNFTMDEASGAGALGRVQNCVDSISGGLCGGAQAIFVGPMYNNSNAYDHYDTAAKPSASGTGFIPLYSGSYMWSFYVNDPSLNIVDPETGETTAYSWTRYDLNVCLQGWSPCAPTVPIPAAAWLFGSGLLGLASRIRRRPNSA